MKLNLFLSVVSIFAVLHLCKAGPLRIQKRAAFYIANETACVVDNIVYSNGDPIPTDDPCEACKCRPPGFACVLKECKVKVGCRAVRHAGQCCPEYICGCEHNGRMYRDGDEIRDPKNPCYICHCQGSSIACAFVDCFFRDDCDSMFVPGECCPQYTNCTKDTPDKNPFTGGNALPPINLLPALNDESVLPGDLPSTKTPEPSEAPTNPTEPPQPAENNEETKAPESGSAEVSSESPIVKSESLVTEESKLDPETEEKGTEGEETSNEEKKEDLPEEESEDKAVETVDESEVLLNSETDIKKSDTTESTTVKDDPPQPTVEAVKEEPQTTVANEIEEAEHEAEVTEKSPEVESTSTEIPESDQQVKNSASENGKSLKLSDDDLSIDPQKEKEIQDDKPENTENKQEETVTELPSESSSEAQTIDTKESSSTESKPESEENIAEETQTNPQATSFYSSNEKIKSETAETVTIVVHVKEKAKLSTETDFVTENTTPESATSVTQENLLKSNELGNTEISEESSKVNEAESTNKNFEIFPTSTKINEVESTTYSPSTHQNSEEVQGRSEETDTTASKAEENPSSEEMVSDSKSTEDLSVATTTQNVNSASEASKEARANEEASEETKTDEPTVTVIRIDPNGPIRIEIITDPAEPPKTEESTKEEGNEEATEETTSEEIAEETKSEETVEKTKSEESVDETKPEVREDESKPEEKAEETTVHNIEESTPLEKVQETTPAPIEYKPEERAEATESQETAEKTNTENIENTETEESKSKKTTESQNQGTEAPSHKE